MQCIHSSLRWLTGFAVLTLSVAGVTAQEYVPGLDHDPMGEEAGGSYVYWSWHGISCSEANCFEPIDFLNASADFMGYEETCGDATVVGDLYCSTDPKPTEQCSSQSQSGWFELTTKLNSGGQGNIKTTASLEYCEAISGEGGGDGGEH